jgi:uncharacterized protein YceK
MKKLLGLLACLVLLAGCGTLFNGTDANMRSPQVQIVRPL